jgi:hypothetical protein
MVIVRIFGPGTEEDEEDEEEEARAADRLGDVLAGGATLPR